MSTSKLLNCNGRLISLSSPVVMGIINITPDSFYEGSRFRDTDAIKKRADAEKAKARVLFFCEIRRSAASGTRFHSKPCPDPLAQAGFAKLSCPSCSIY